MRSVAKQACTLVKITAMCLFEPENGLHTTYLNDLRVLCLILVSAVWFWKKDKHKRQWQFSFYHWLRAFPGIFSHVFTWKRKMLDSRLLWIKHNCVENRILKSQKDYCKDWSNNVKKADVNYIFTGQWIPVFRFIRINHEYTEYILL